MTGGAAGAGSAPAAPGVCCHRTPRRPRRGRCRCPATSARLGGVSVAAPPLGREGAGRSVPRPGDDSADADFAKTSWDVKNHPGRQARLLVASSASIRPPGHDPCRGGWAAAPTYANTLYRPPRVLRDLQWRDSSLTGRPSSPLHYDTASRMPRRRRRKPVRDGPAEQVMKRALRTRASAGPIARLPSGSSSAPPVSPCPTLLAARARHAPAAPCAATAWSVAASGPRTPLVKNYLCPGGPGVHIEPMRTVTHLGRSWPRGSDGRAAYRIRHEATGTREGERECPGDPGTVRRRRAAPGARSPLSTR